MKANLIFILSLFSLNAFASSVSGEIKGTYPSGAQMDYEGCYYCDVNFYPQLNSGIIRLQQGEGYVVWMINIRKVKDQISIDLTVSENSPMLSKQDTGFYYDGVDVSDKFVFSQLELTPGGAVVGKFKDVVVFNKTTNTSATFSGSIDVTW